MDLFNMITDCLLFWLFITLPEREFANAVYGILEQFNNYIDVVGDFWIIIAESGSKHPEDRTSLPILFPFNCQDREETKFTSFTRCFSLSPFLLRKSDIIKFDTCFVKTESNRISSTERSKVFQLWFF